MELEDIRKMSAEEISKQIENLSEEDKKGLQGWLDFWTWLTRFNKDDDSNGV